MPGRKRAAAGGGGGGGAGGGGGGGVGGGGAAAAPARPRPPPPQPARHRVRAGVAEVGRGCEHAVAELRAELVGAVVGVRDRRARDAEVGGDVGEGDGGGRRGGCHLNRSRLYRFRNEGAVRLSVLFRPASRATGPTASRPVSLDAVWTSQTALRSGET